VKIAILWAPKFLSITILDRLTGSDPSVSDYILEDAAKCPNCRHDVLEKTLVEPA
jgi:hypothetical protein